MGQNQSFDVFYDLENAPQAFACGIVIVAPKSGDDSLTELRWLPNEAKIIGIGLSLEELEKDGVPIQLGNVLVNISGDAKILGPIIRAMPNLEWVHSTTAGVDHILCPEIIDNDGIVFTNSRGVFSSSLAEYVIGACLYFAKGLRRLDVQKEQHKWERFPMAELRGKTMGIVGCGNIGSHCAAMAKCFGMRVLALRRQPELCEEDENIDEAFYPDDIGEFSYSRRWLHSTIRIDTPLHCVSDFFFLV
jgi:hypothetical protein